MAKLIHENCKHESGAQVPETFEAECDKYDHTELYFAREMFAQTLNERNMPTRKDDESLSELYVRAFKITLRQARREVQQRRLVIHVKDRPR